MYPEDMYNNPYNYSYNNSTGGWLFLIILIIIAIILVKLGNNNSDYISDETDTNNYSNGVAEYWYSDTPEHTVHRSEAVGNRDSIRKTPVTGTSWAAFNIR